MDSLTLDQMDDWVGDEPQEIIDMFNMSVDPGTDPGEDDKFPGVIDDEGKVGTLIKEFGDHDWVVLAREGNNALIYSEMLTKEEIEDMGFSPMINSYNADYYGVSFNKTGVQSDYLKSQSYDFVQSFYEMYIKNRTEENWVKPIVINPEPIKTNVEAILNKSGYAYPNEAGTKQAYLLAISDLNYYEIDSAILNIPNGQGNFYTSSRTVMSNSVSILGNSSTWNQNQILNINLDSQAASMSMALWIELP